jgi:hypothetical protein
MIDEVNYYLTMECHLYCSVVNTGKVFVDCNNNYTVHWDYMPVLDYNKMMDDYIHMIVDNWNN